MTRTSMRRLLWIALGGLLIGIAGVGWDMAWHRQNPGALAGVREIVEAHWMMLVGVAILSVALFVAAWSVRGQRSGVTGIWIGAVGALAMVVGFAWDSVRHIQGTESAVAHGMIYAGLVLVVIGLPVALVSSRRWEPTSR